MIHVCTEQRFTLTTRADGTKQTELLPRHDALMRAVADALANNRQIVSVDTLESAVRQDALTRGAW